jgi:hypothetical protein
VLWSAVDEWFAVLKEIGPVGAIFVGFGWLYRNNHIATGRELQLLRDALALEQAEHLRERLELRQEIAFWRDHAWSLARAVEQTTRTEPTT